MVRHALAPLHPPSARALGLTRTLPGPGVALTFDDGPHPTGTPEILRVLELHGIQATFFLVGEQVDRRPGLAREILDRGHAVGVHAHRHRLQLRLSPRGLREDVIRALAAIHAATGTSPRLHRAPYGIYSAAGVQAARAAGLEPLLWSRWGRDWRRLTTPARITARVTARVAPGDVLLLHDADFYSAQRSHERTAAALPGILAELRRRGLGTVLPV